MHAIATLVIAGAACGRVGFAARPDGTPVDAAAKTYAQVILADLPVGYWRLGEATGIVAHDLSGHSFDGTYEGGVTLGQPGALVNDPDTAISLDGTTGFVRIPHEASLDSISNGIASAEGWVRGGIAGAQEVWSAWDGNANGYQLIYDNGVAGAWTGAGIVNSSLTISDDSWHHLVAVWNGAECAVYVDGAQRAAGACHFTATTLDNQIGTQCMAANSTMCNDFRPGDTDEVAVYDYALSASAIATHYNAGLGRFQ